MIKKFTKKRILIEVLFLFIVHFLISFLLKNIGNQEYSWKSQLIESIIFSILMVAIYWGVNKWNQQWKNKHN